MEDIKKYVDVLKTVKITVIDKGKGTFSPAHEKYDVCFRFAGKAKHFPYQCNPAYGQLTKLMVLYAVLLDRSTYLNVESVEGLISDFGYDDVREATKIFKECKKNSEKIEDLFESVGSSEFCNDISDFLNEVENGNYEMSMNDLEKETEK